MCFALVLLFSLRARFLTGLSLGALVGLGGNLFGSTSAILSVAPEKSRSLRLDILYPVDGFKRYYSSGEFEFLYPQEWLEDPAVAVFENSRRTKPLDLSMQSARKVNSA